MEWDFQGYATRNGIKCSDGRTIMRDAFKDQDGTEVPLVWNHDHNSPESILGKAKLENREDGVFVYAQFNDTDRGQLAKKLVRHKDITALSIYANKLKERAGNVLHGVIREVSLVLAGANPGALIDSYVAHSDGSVEEDRTQGMFYSGLEGELYHSEDMEPEEKDDQEPADEDEARMERIRKIMERRAQSSTEENGEESKEDDEDEEKVSHADSDDSDTNPDEDTGEDDEDDGGEAEHSDSDDSDNGGKTVGDVLDTFTEDQMVVVAAMIDDAVDEALEKSKENKEDSTMQHNLFDKETAKESNVLTHSDEMKIVSLMKEPNIGTLKGAIKTFCDNEALAHGFDSQSLTLLFPEYQDLKPGAPEMLTTDQGWISKVLSKINKIPIAKVRVRFTDIRDIENIRAKGYTKGTQKTLPGDVSAIYRVADPQTVYVRSDLDRDDIIDMVDFDYVQYMYNIDRMVLNEELATASMLGDGREAGNQYKIREDRIIPVWKDDELFTIHRLVDFDAVAAELQGSNTTGYFGENFIYAETFVQELLYARETAKNVGNADLYITPHVLNKMLLARDRNGRRIYNTVEELRSALNVREIITCEQFEGKTRTVGNKERELLGILYKFENYDFGASKGGQIVHFTDFDLDYNKEKSLLETRVSGMNTRPLSAVVLESEVSNP